MHRNTLLFVSFLAVVAAFLVGMNFGRTIPRTIITTAVPTQATIPTPTVAYLTYTDETCDLSLQYPNNLQVLESTNSGTIFVDPNNDTNAVVVVCQEGIPRVPLPPEKITSLTLKTETGATVSAKIYHDASAKDGIPVDKLIFTYPKSGQDIYIAGYGNVFAQIVSSLILK